ncbi:uncharacterized protein C8R40DRAFT_1115448 [Lentinula edodes]|uniref:uncharacterized protein n=1 Tax=Lentinula edodes TaxID=5353 RepID=UPI001E8D592E|nr:uncharacterized protein C8R40DRAFT_1115448 [Lentinula edodes]KAH7872745.1 hypothetical protein C8R40DRAFT_1115448 [Lentinula edodes]
MPLLQIQSMIFALPRLTENIAVFGQFRGRLAWFIRESVKTFGKLVSEGGACLMDFSFVVLFYIDVGRRSMKLFPFPMPSISWI